MGSDLARAASRVLGRGRVGTDRLMRLDEAVQRHGLAVVARFSAAALGHECGFTPGQAERLAGAFALGREAERAPWRAHPSVRRPGDVAKLLAPELRGLEVESFQAVLLDVRHRLKARVEISRGTLTSAPVHPREVFLPALRHAAAAVVVAHNHPSGDPCPSAEDIDVTRRLGEAGRILGVPLLDHLILAGGSWVSMRESGDWPRRPGSGVGCGVERGSVAWPAPDPSASDTG